MEWLDKVYLFYAYILSNNSFVISPVFTSRGIPLLTK